ncbi:MAG: GDP-mannose 4,6-dehydratase [Thermoguttaceae bacterium]|nr:GDP-mannose 4,6-dehydratase [Thermoguttaceae bacterium]
MKHALVTGGAGFIGSHLCERLLATGHKVSVLDDLSTGRYSNIEHLERNHNFHFYVDSVLNTALTEELIRASDQVYHLASAVGVEFIVARPVHTIESIVDGTEVVLRSCNRYRRPVLVTSTSEVYGKGAKIPFREEDDTVSGPTSRRRWAYACAKALDEFLSLAYWYESRLPVRIARLFNTVGPRQTGQYGMVVPRFVQAALAGKPVRVYGDGQQSRCFAHVQDIVDGLISLMNCRAAEGQVVNLGNEEEITIEDLARRIIDATGSSSLVEHVAYDDAYGPGFEDMQRRVPCLDKARELIGYKAVRGLSDIINDVTAEFRSRAEG